MSRTHKDAPYELGGHRHKYCTGVNYHAWFTRQCRRAARAKAKDDLRKGREPQPVYPVESGYYD